jgi:hypothetical protein
MVPDRLTIREGISLPAATPLPRGPAVLTLYTAADLLTGPGCPVCRYASEAASHYLTWFALEGHGDAVTVTRLCASLGMCPRHTRGLMSQPGAARRLTALYRYLTRAARDRLAGHAARLAGCPGCGHDDGAVGRALEPCSRVSPTGPSGTATVSSAACASRTCEQPRHRAMSRSSPAGADDD